MPSDLSANAQAYGQPSGGCEPLSSLCREIGLAAVATELNLQLNTLELDVAEAVERGTAALFRAGYGPGLTRYSRSVRAGEEGDRRKGRRVESKARQSSKAAIPIATMTSAAPPN